MQRVERKIEYLFDRLLHSYHNETPENKKTIIRDLITLFWIIEEQSFLSYYDEECEKIFEANKNILEESCPDYTTFFCDVFNNSRHIIQKLIDPKYSLENKTRIKRLTKYNIDDSIRLAKDFFRAYNIDLYKHFLYLLKNDSFGIIRENELFWGLTYSIYYPNESIVLIKNFKSIYTAFLIIHETMRSFVIHNTPNKNIRTDVFLDINRLQEVPTYYIELVFINYLKEIGIKQNDINFLEQRRIVLFKEHFENFKKKVTNPEFNNLVSDEDYLVKYQRSEEVVYGYTFGSIYFSKYLDGKIDLEPIELAIDSASNKRYLILDKHGIYDEDLEKENLERKLR